MARGINAMADAIRTTTDGVDLNDIWNEHQATIQIRNSARSALAALFTYTTDLSADVVAQAATDGEFEVASEYGVPQSLRSSPDLVKVGFPLKFYDLATRFTWRFLAEASASQVAAVHSSALEADNKLVFKLVMGALFASASSGSNEDGTPVVPLWSGDDTVPPEFAGNTFDGSHTHYMTSGSTALDPADLELLIEQVRHHGYGLKSNGDQVVVLLNPQESKSVQGFRAGVNGAAYDFIPSDAAAAFITSEAIVGDRPSGEFNGLSVVGSYADALLVENPYVPANYTVSVATGGPNNERNPLAFREHKRDTLKGLQQIGGGSAYPIVDSYYVRGAGVGVRHRGAAAIMQVTASTTYTAPSI